MRVRPPDCYSATIALFLSVAHVLLMQVDGRRMSRRDVFSTKEFFLDMADSSFDDQYKGCSDLMEAEIPQLFKIEYSTNKEFADAWDTAAFKWEEKKKGCLVIPKDFKDEYAIALLAYTINGPLHKVFNDAVRDAGLSLQYYLRNFNFKVLHYYLTKALQLLDVIETPACYRVYRGIRGIRFKFDPRKTVRFGQFTSSSTKYESALMFGEDTFFNINTCYGVNIKNYSFFPGEEEVLIPPYEKFKVTNFIKERDRNYITLNSVEKSSVYNCELVKATSTQMKINSLEIMLVSVLVLLTQPLGDVFYS
ncbi:GPI-linked NAD(P)(+)--arginine ADP-ribosyltransferase 1 isoform X2 [Pseudophryne corroboree]|uniref:GPI-linked NAD(P)(+)--arginine ADP-ribosyltransferase 1 isoform X2 n=1 Tax=Pseudophryne corroboree TaxID=495146 RepID=UPI003081EE63